MAPVAPTWGVYRLTLALAILAASGFVGGWAYAGAGATPVAKRIPLAKSKNFRGTLRAGNWIVEQPTTQHSAANRGNKKVVIYLSNLLKTGAPASTPAHTGSR